MKQILKNSLKVILVIFGLIITYILAVLLLPLIPVNQNQNNQEDDTIEIYILTNGVHTDIVVPVVTDVINWSTIVPFSDTKSQKEKDLIAFGWGDKGFYLDTPEWSDLKASTAFKAAFSLGSSAMHTHFYNKLKEDEDCVKISINKSDYQNMVEYIKKSFVYDKDGKIEYIPTEMVNKDDAYYEATGSYSLFFTCNTWASGALKSANQVAPWWTATQQGIFRYYK